MTQTLTLTWTTVCLLDRLEPDRGVAALVDGVQIALFRTDDGLFAIDNRDPVSGAYVLSRGIVGSRGGVPTVASPLHKQVYDLRTGHCLDLPGVAVARHDARCRDGLVEVRLRQGGLMREELAGFTIGVTADRRRDELAALLERRGARVVLAPALRIVPLSDDTELREATRACLDQPPDILMANTGIGMRGWLEAAEGWGLAEPLRSVLAELVPGRPAARRRAARSVRPGCTTSGRRPRRAATRWSTTCVGAAWPGQVIAMQLHGERQPECTLALEAAGATVIEVPVYRWAPPTDPAPLHRLVDLIAGRLVDAVTFTSAPAVEALLRAAGDRTATRCWRRCAPTCWPRCVGPVTAAPLLRHGVPVSAPGRARLGALVRTIVDELPRRAVTLEAGGHLLTLRGHAAIIDGELRPLAPAPMAVLRALAAVPRPGAVPRGAAADAAPGRGRARGGDGGGPPTGRPGRAPRGADRGEARLPAPGRLSASRPAGRCAGRDAAVQPTGVGKPRPCSACEPQHRVLDDRHQHLLDRVPVPGVGHHQRHLRRDGQRLADLLQLVLRRAVEAVQRHHVRQVAVLEVVQRRERVGDPAGVHQHGGAHRTSDDLVPHEPEPGLTRVYRRGTGSGPRPW